MSDRELGLTPRDARRLFDEYDAIYESKADFRKECSRLGFIEVTGAPTLRLGIFARLRAYIRGPRRLRPKA